MNKNNSYASVRRMVTLALFCALAYATMFVLRIKVSFLTFDAKDAVITIAGMFFGPLAAALISLIVALIEMMSVSDTAFYGFIMNFLSSAAFSVTASMIYKYKRNIIGAIIGLASGVAAMTAIMVLFNLLITPLYMSVDISTVANMIIPLLLPFNITKALLNASLVMILYKPISMAMKQARVIPRAQEGYDSNKVVSHYKCNIIVIISAVVVAVGSIIVLMLLLNGNFEWVKK